MKNGFYIKLYVQTVKGFEEYGSFFIGDDQAQADALFDSLAGSEVAQEKDILHLDFVEIKSGLPVNVRVLSCTLDQLAVNCKLITKDVFRRLNLENL